MKRRAMVIIIVGVVLGLCGVAFAQGNEKPAAQNPPAGQAAGQAAAAPQGKRPPQAKTQPEYEAYKTAMAIRGTWAADGKMTAGQAVLTSARNPFTAGMVGFHVMVGGAGPSGGTLTTSVLSFQSAGQVTLTANASTTVTAAAVVGAGDVATLEKAADDFATKFPDSELRVMIYKSAMQQYQQANNADKMLEMGRKALGYDPDDPEALVGVAEVLVERTRDTDLDKDQRLAEARKNVERALVTVDTDVPTANQPTDRVEAYKGYLRSEAYAILGTMDYNNKAWPEAESNLRKSIDALPQQPDPVAVLRLTIALDNQKKYPEALKYADQAVDLTKDHPDSLAGKAARSEKDRLTQLNSGTAPGQNPAPPKN
jgi:hypothetical protein